MTTTAISSVEMIFWRIEDISRVFLAARPIHSSSQDLSLTSSASKLLPILPSKCCTEMLAMSWGVRESRDMKVKGRAMVRRTMGRQRPVSSKFASEASRQVYESQDQQVRVRASERRSVWFRQSLHCGCALHNLSGSLFPVPLFIPKGSLEMCFNFPTLSDLSVEHVLYPSKE